MNNAILLFFLLGLIGTLSAAIAALAIRPLHRANEVSDRIGSAGLVCIATAMILVAIQFWSKVP